MKAILTIEIEFDSWFTKEREPTTKDAWKKFFIENLFSEASILGNDTEEHQDMIDVSTFDIKNIKII